MKRSLITTAFIMSSMLCAQEYVLEPVGIQEDVSENENVQIDAQDIKQRQARTTKEIFATEPSVIVGGGSSHAQRLYLRGIEQSNLLITIDGAQQGRSMHQRHGSALQIDPTILKQVEVDTSPGADAGPGALGGAIRFTTIDAQDVLKNDEIVGATLRAGYSSVDSSKIGGITLYSKAFDKMGILLHATKVDSENYRMGNGEKVENSAGEDEKYFLKLSLLNVDGHSLRLNAQRDVNKGTRVWNKDGSDIGYTQPNSRLYPMTKERDTFGAEYIYKPNNPFVHVKARVNQNEFNFEWDENERSNKNLAADIRNTALLKLFGTEHAITLGVDFAKEESQGSGGATSFGAENFGIYIQDRMHWKNIKLSFGVRQDNYDSDLGVMQLKGDELSSNIGLEYKLIDSFTLFGNYGEAVRTKGNVPVMWFLMADDTTTYNGKHLNENPDPFKPEMSERMEYGFKYRTQAFFSDNDKFSIKANVFETKIDNLIGGTGGGGKGLSDVSNLPRLVSKGYELRMDYGYKDVKSMIVYSNTKVEDKDGVPYTSSTGKRNGALPGERVVWDNKWMLNSSLFVGYTMHIAMDLDEVPVGQVPREGYVLHDIQMTWNPDFLPSAEFALAINNLSDEAYSDSTTLGTTEEQRVYEPGRDIRFNATYRF